MMRVVPFQLVLGLLAAIILSPPPLPAGASTPETPAADVRLEEPTLWSLRPLRKPDLPEATHASAPEWRQNPIDRFVAARLEQAGLKPSPPADRRTLLRRVYFDLVGLPPTPADLAAFVADPAPDAYEKVVERLLASPRHGERWARHWLDVVHYAETHGHDQDRPRANAWPYRDWLIRALNSDMPYTRFVQSQIAGDVLFPDDPQALVATGFLAAGPWDESSLRDIRDDTIDRQIARYLDRDDIITSTMSTFLSVTAHCARCHDHKFDPITTTDYYSLQAVFSGVDKVERPFDDDPAVHRLRQSLLEERTAIEVRGPTIRERLLSDAFQTEVATWEDALRKQEPFWEVLSPESVASEGGATFEVLPDGSLFAGGTRPAIDTCTVTAVTRATNITALRLEVLADDRLPHKGPGRQDNGNLHLSEFRIQVAPLSGATETWRNVPIARASADFNQQDWDIEKSIDGRTNTAWGIFPQVGQSHFAVFETAADVGFEAGTRFTFRLDQLHGQGHLIGRFRLSTTTHARPVRARSAPPAIDAILSIATPSRTVDQKLELAVHVRTEQIDRQLQSLPAPRMVYAVASNFKPESNFVPAKTPRPVHVLKRGDIHRPGAPASPGALACISGLDARFPVSPTDGEGARRAALARWITDTRNVLTWRSIVNRVWHHHFGRGIVETPNDFGRMGALPSHSELLDWLATTFLEEGGSLKALHRRIVTSAAYRQSVRHDPHAESIDADNALLWRMNRSRLDAESIRDAILQMNDRLDLTMYGPSVRQFIERPGVHVTPVVDYAAFNVDHPDNHRRSIYRFVFRTLPDPFMEALDCPDAAQLTPKRNTSVTALQALALWNNPFMIRQSEHLADRLQSVAPTLEGQVAAACDLAWNRPPTPAESERFASYARRHGLANFCRLLLNTSEFVFLN